MFGDKEKDRYRISDKVYEYQKRQSEGSFILREYTPKIFLAF